MRQVVKKFCIGPADTVLEALKKIEKNTKGFVVVINKDDTVFGVLTDGDIRRAFINGFTINTAISEICKKNVKCLSINDNISDAIDLFKNEAINFLPIINQVYKLENIITKSQINSLLMQDICVDLTYEFTDLDENTKDYEIFQRPWGFYKITVMNNYFQSKLISVNPKAQLSLQSHNHREEYWIIVHGSGKVQIGESLIEVKCGSSIFIPKGCKHRLINIDNNELLIVTEVQIGDYFGEDDIIRYEDMYGRV